MTTFLTHVNAALTRCGLDPITSFDDGTIEANTAGENYEPMVKECLSAAPWRFARTTKTLNLISGTPNPPWQYAYQLPTDVMMLRQVSVGGHSIAYERQGGKVLTNEGADVIAMYTWRPNEPDWLPAFAEYVTIRLEALFLRAIKEDSTGADKREEKAKEQKAEAKRLDAQQASSRDPFDYPIKRARSG